MTIIDKYTVVKKESAESTLSNIFKTLSFQEKNYYFIVELLMEVNVGYNRDCVLLLNDYSKVVVLENFGRQILVKTLKPGKEFKPVTQVLRILTRKWGGNNEGIA